MNLQQAALTIPGLHYLLDLRTRFQRRYARGIFRTFQEARAAIPAGRLAGWDNVESSRLHLDLIEMMNPSDYAIVYWLGPLLAACGGRVFDFGGNLGTAYYAFRKYLHYPPDLRWLVCDVPAVVAAGREVARERNASHLEFTTEFSEVEDFDILFTSGTLQLLEEEFASSLAKLKRKPRHLLINRVPLVHRPTYYTVADQTTSCCAYRLANRAEFIGSLQRLGYSLVDSWQCYELACRVLFHPARSLRPYSGMYLRLAVPQASYSEPIACSSGCGT